ncbi:MAG TPA: hypothetical protein VJA82_03345 [Sediminibacterium sp.]|uniref:hypothetical protein n=1 Tax=Sediminibacterium sp. TaxID=1917865 RepID=UPI0008BFA505|nr:hypothetical protein [Sediminibacterium sp.]OHC85017.1 MAG: hypothetical protein A2472_09710 [Sphingobacteriia bacterium RIFOXYC2_FULL_35_18]OHC87068.1 MAG: hypothetical protein A2546_14300 [Sphingobacteriia bacterium RIFOXYD2_FULL_35_12]HLD52314.1 hypothetical protein [Sediminibacterium sp.]
MKKILIASAILVSTSSFATTTTSSNDKGNLKSLLGKVSNVQWKSAANFEKASVVIEEQKVEVFYNQEGDLIGSTRYQDFDKLPKNAIKTITSKYTFPEYNLQECIVFTNGYNEATYYVSMTTETDYLVLAITEYGEVSIFSNTRK